MEPTQIGMRWQKDKNEISIELKSTVDYSYTGSHNSFITSIPTHNINSLITIIL